MSVRSNKTLEVNYVLFMYEIFMYSNMFWADLIIHLILIACTVHVTVLLIL